jgi:uncharacterized protein YegL
MNNSSFNEADYYKPKRLLVLVLDKSASMDFSGMQEINNCLQDFVEDAKFDNRKFSSVEFSVIAFNQKVDTIVDVSNILNVEWQPITTEGCSDIILGIIGGINSVKNRVDYYKSMGYEYYKPWLVLITDEDNQQNVNIQALSKQIRQDVRNEIYEFIPVGVGNVSMALLEELKGSIMPVKLQYGRYSKFFNWLYTTVGNFSSSRSPEKQLDDIRPKIFISYKRVDKEKVIRIKRQIEEKLDLTCWFDVDGIESDAQFANVIINAINECEVFLFMYSHAHSEINDLDNDWTIREINFAQKKKKRIVFVNIDGAELTDWFEMMFGTKQQVEANSEQAMRKLLLDISNWLDL